MALKAHYNDLGPEGAGMRALVAIDYSGGNQTVLAATTAAGMSAGALPTSVCAGLLVTVAGDFELIPVYQTTAVVVPLGKGYYPVFPVTQINIAGSTGSGFYVF